MRRVLALPACIAVLLVGVPVRADEPKPAGARTDVRPFGASPVPAEALVPGVLATSPGQDHVSVVVDRPGASTVWIDGKAGEPFETIETMKDPTEPRCIWGKTGRYAYAGGRGGKAFVVVDGVARGPYDAARLGSFAFHAQGRRFAGILVRGEQRVVVHDGGEDPPVAGVWGATVGYTPDGATLGYCATIEGLVRLVRGGRVVEDAGSVRDDETLDTAVTPDRAHWAALAKTPKGDLFVLDGKPSRPYRKAEKLQNVAIGNGFAYRTEEFLPAAPDQGREFSEILSRWVIGGVEQPGGINLGSLWTSDDGKHFAYGRKQVRKPLELIRDGQAVLEQSPSLVVVGSGMDFSPDGRRLAIHVMKDDAHRLWIDGTLTEPLAVEEVRAVVFSPDSAHWACRVRPVTSKADDPAAPWHLLVDGTVRAKGPALRPYGFTPDGAFVVYATTSPDGKWRLEAVRTSGDPAAVASEAFDRILSDAVAFPDPRTARVVALRGQEIVRVEFAFGTR